MVGQGLMPLQRILVSRVFGQTAYGLYRASADMCEVLMRAGMVGADKGLLRFVAAHRAANEPDLEERAIGSALRLAGGVLSFLALGLMLAAPTIARISGNVEFSWLLPVMAPALLAGGLVIVLMAATLGAKVTRVNLFIRGVAEPVLLLATTVVAWLVGRSLTGLAAAHLLTYLALLVLAWVGARTVIGRGRLWRSLRQLPHGGFSKFVLPIGGSELMNAILQRANVFILTAFAGAPTVAVFAAAEELGRSVAGIRYAFDSVAGPMMAESLRLRDVERIVPLAAGCVLLGYIESVSAARTFAAKHGYSLDPRQEFLGIGAANLAAALGHGYPVAGGLSQSAVNDKAGARTPLALIFASCTLALCLLFLTGLLANLPKAVLAAVVLTAVYGLIDFPAMLRMWRISRMDFYAAAIALGAVLLLGILQGILLAALASVLMLLARASSPHVAFLGRIPGTMSYSDLARHPENEPLPHVVAFRPEASLLYVNADSVLGSVSARLEAEAARDIRLVVCDLSASPHIDLAGARMLHQLHLDLARRGIALRIVGARGRVRDLLRAEGIGEKVGGLDRLATLDDLLGGAGR